MGGSGDQLDNGLIFPTLFVFAVVSWLVYRFVLVQQPAGATSTAATQVAPAGALGRPQGAARAAPVPAANHSHAMGEDFSYGMHRHPPHLLPPDGWADKKNRISLSGYLNQGVVPFRSTSASGYEARLQQQMKKTTLADKAEATLSDLVAVNRRERARIFARLFSNQLMRRNTSSSSSQPSEAKKMIPPPNRGANIVVTIHQTDVGCGKLNNALFLLGTYYNLFVVVDMSNASFSEGEKKDKNLINKIRGDLLHCDVTEDLSQTTYKLSSEILPPHRIVFSTTSAGRVAFVRQMHGVELVVDPEEKVANELDRFGFRVLVYPKSESIVGASSALGKTLLP